MDIRRATFGAAIRLAIVLSSIAAAITLGLDAVGEVPRSALVLGVMVIGFAASWVQTGRAGRTADRHLDRHLGHRVAVVPVRHPVG